MKYSYTWLQSHIEESLPTPEKLREVIHNHAFEVESVEKVAEDNIFDIAVLPDRAGDCLSHFGMAREIAGLLNLTLKSTTHALPEMPLLLPVEIKSDLVRRYIAVRMDGVKVLESPKWLRDALEAVGQRSINNIVDVTNFILLDTGQPTHAFDSANIDGGIVVRPAHEGETIVTLSDETKTLKETMLVIADYVGALGVAGVKGGKSAQVTDATTSIVLEIANFDPVSVRTTARALGLPTDAAKRFENNLSPETAYQAAAQLVALIKDIAGGEVTGVSEQYPSPVAARTIECSVTDIARLLGAHVNQQKIARVFDQYHYTYTYNDELFTLTVPYWRADITGTHDIADEIGRVLGYDTTTALSLPALYMVAHSPVFQSMRAVRAWLVHDGYREVMTYTFRPKGDVEIARGAKGKQFLRTNLSDGLKDSFDLNKQHAALLGLSEVKLFEIGTVFSTEKEEIHVAIADKDGIREMTLDTYINEHAIVIEHARLEITPAQNSFAPWSVYPFVTRDVAVWVEGEGEARARLQTLVQEFATQYCVRPPTLFDEFTKDGKTSVAYRFVFQSFEKTLTEADVEVWMQILNTSITKDTAYTIR